MNLPRVQYITHPEEDFSNLSWLDNLAEGGVKWVQLRIKEADLAEFHPNLHFKATLIEIADLIREKTKELSMILTINDHPEIARLSNADGCHIGMEDSKESSDLVDFEIVGGTAHDLNEIDSYSFDMVTYFGVGPYKTTSTKRKIKSVLGIQGYQDLISELKIKNKLKPIFAIGGIEEKDIEGIMKTSVHGIAVSGLLHNNNFDSELIKRVVQKTNNYARSV